MVKPKFTPDPPPNIDGLPVEEQVRMLLDHMQRTHNRIEDWWPKDFENRIQALEGLVPYKIGPWVMVSVSSMDWGYEAYTVALPCEITTVTYSQAFDYTSESTSYSGFKFDETGTKLLALKSGVTGAFEIYGYTASTAFDSSTLSTNGSASVASTGANGTNLAVSANGVSFFYGNLEEGVNPALIRHYSMSTPFDVGTASLTSQLNVNTNNSTVRAIELTRDGSQMLLMNNLNDKLVHIYNLSVPFVLSSASYAGTHTLPGMPAFFFPVFLRFDNTGEHIYAGAGDTFFHRLSLSTAFDVTTASYDVQINPPGTGAVYDISASPDCDKLFLLDLTNDEFKEYLID